MAKSSGGAESGQASKDWREGDRGVDLHISPDTPVDESAHWLLFQSVPVGLFEARLDGEIVRCNPHAVELFTGSFPGDLAGGQMADLFDTPSDWRSLADDLQRIGLVVGREALMTREGATNFWAQLDARLVVPADDEVRVLGAVQDITAQKHREERLRKSAGHDPLTGLPHRAALMERLKRESARMRRDLTHRFAVGFVDLDDFKRINDGHGHIVGDQVLLAVAHRLKRGLRPEDTVYRYGGDEFAVVLQGVEDADAAAIVGARMLEVLQSPFQIQDGMVEVSASVGIRVCASPQADPDQLLHSADRAMYEAKGRGGEGRVEVVIE